MALYAFDGTWNADEEDEAKETNVLKFRKCLPLDMWEGGGWLVMIRKGILVG